MKATVAFLCLFLVAYPAAIDSQGVCGGGCSSSAECATNGGDILCRCVNFVCSMTDPCGGGCVADKQCEQWGGGDEECYCSWNNFQCQLRSRVNAPGHPAFFDVVAGVKMSKEKREQILKVQQAPA